MDSVAKHSLKVSLPATLMVFAWLLPNHYHPWVSAWGDGMAISGLLLLLPLAMAGTSFVGHISWQLLVVVSLCCASILLQLATGKLLFAGDAWIALLYIGSWFAALLAGRAISLSSASGDGVSMLSGAWLLAALLSVGIALVQWSGALNLGIYAAELPPGGRPFANVAQPNNFCTLSFLGLCGLMWLYQFRRVNGPTFWVGAIFLLCGMIASQSRTGWLQLSLIIAFGGLFRGRLGLRISRVQIGILGSLFLTGVFLWSPLCDALFLSAGRTLDDQMQAGIRLPYWWVMLDAIGREPFWGYGWQQVGSAQQHVALDHPALGSYFEHSHNLVLDFLLWSGIPIGGLIVAALIWWFVSRVGACRDARVGWLLVAAGGLLIHSMLEFPMEYFYFLAPMGLAMGSVDGFLASEKSLVRVPRQAVLILMALLTIFFLWSAAEYLKAEENYRTMRLESARIGVPGIVTPSPRLIFLTQLDAFLQFGRTEAKPGMSAAEIDWMRKVSERFGFPPILFRYALAAGLNGQPKVAQETLERICRIHALPRCLEARESWKILEMRYPALVGLVD